MFDEYINKISELRKKNEAFVTATVVRREAPSSGKTGDKAVINKYGEIIGWVGGGCVKAIIIKEAEDALQTGKARLVKIGQNSSTQIPEGIMEYKMTCQSEGSIEIFIDPVLPIPHLVVMGKSVIAQALVKIGKASGYRVTAVAPGSRPDTFPGVDELITQLSLHQVKMSPASFIVVCTQGEQDEAALEEALKSQSAYVGFVASKKKRSSVFEYLENAGIDKEKIEIIRSPAGIDINAKKPGEVAISILAEIIQLQNSTSNSGFVHFSETGETEVKSKYYINPVCGVPIDVNNPKHVIEYKGEKVYFCCDGCKLKFEAEPEKYMNKQPK
jgi:Xanthine and CO dehydrogenases maturation factor, XdhC/CoxF family